MTNSQLDHLTTLQTGLQSKDLIFSDVGGDGYVPIIRGSVVKGLNFKTFEIWTIMTASSDKPLIRQLPRYRSPAAFSKKTSTEMSKN